MNTAPAPVEAATGPDYGSDSGFQVPDPHLVADVAGLSVSTLIVSISHADIASGRDTNRTVVENTNQLLEGILGDYDGRIDVDQDVAARGCKSSILRCGLPTAFRQTE